MQLTMLNGAPNRRGKLSVKTPVLHSNKNSIQAVSMDRNSVQEKRLSK